MTIEERVARVEVRQASTDEWLRDIDEKQDRILEAINSGKGAVRVLLALSAIVGGIAALWAIAKAMVGLQ